MVLVLNLIGWKNATSFQDKLYRIVKQTKKDPRLLLTHYPLTHKRDQDKISPYKINTISGKQVMRIRKNMNKEKYELGDYKLIQNHIVW